MANHPNLPSDIKKSETPLDVWSLFNRKIPIIQPILQVIFYYQDQNVDIRVYFTLWVEPEAPGAVVVPLELGLELTHLHLVLDEEEGADLLSEHLHTGQPDVL